MSEGRGWYGTAVGYRCWGGVTHNSLVRVLPVGRPRVVVEVVGPPVGRHLPLPVRRQRHGVLLEHLGVLAFEALLVVQVHDDHLRVGVEVRGTEYEL